MRECRHRRSERLAHGELHGAERMSALLVVESIEFDIELVDVAADEVQMEDDQLLASLQVQTKPNGFSRRSRARGEKNTSLVTTSRTRISKANRHITHLCCTSVSGDELLNVSFSARDYVQLAVASGTINIDKRTIKQRLHLASNDNDHR